MVSYISNLDQARTEALAAIVRSEGLDGKRYPRCAADIFRQRCGEGRGDSSP